MPRKARWRRDGTSESPKNIDLRLVGLGRLQTPSGVIHRSAWDARKNAILEGWALGGIWADGVRAIKAKRIDASEYYTAKVKGDEAMQALLRRVGSEPLANVIRDYLKQSRATDKKKMRQRLERFGRSLPKPATTADVTAANVEAFLASLTDQRTSKTTKTPAAGSTVNRYRAAIGGMCTWAVRVGLMKEHPIAGKKVEKRPEPHHRLPELSADEYRDYIATVRAERPDLAVVLLTLIHQGADVGEVLGIAARDVDLDGARIRYDRPKTARYGPLPRRVPMPALLVAEMRAHVAEHELRGSLKLFAMFRRSDVELMHARAVAVIQRPELTLKDLRHIAAIAWVKAGVHIRVVQKWLGHRSLSETMKYTDFEPSDDAMLDMAERAANTLTETADVTPIRKAQ